MQDAMDRIARFFAAEYADYDEDLPVLTAYAERTGGPLLELGCGAGRALVPLAQAGFAITGVDISPRMLDLARARAAAEGVGDRVTLVQGDFETAALGGPYRFAFCVMNTFLHLPDTAAQIRALKHWRDHLAPRSLLVLDVLHPDVTQLGALDGRLELQQSWADGDTGRMVMKYVARTVELASQTISVHAIYDEIEPDGQMRRTVAPFILRYLWRYEAELVLDKAGFDLEGLYGDWDLGPFTAESQRMICVARPRRRAKSTGEA